MRTASRRLQQRRSYSRSCPTLRSFSTWLTYDVARPLQQTPKWPLGTRLVQRHLCNSAYRSQAAVDAVPIPSRYYTEPVPIVNRLRDEASPSRDKSKRKGFRHDQLIPQLTVDQRSDPATWAELLDRYIPPRLRLPQSSKASESTDVPRACDEIIRIIERGRTKENAGTEILAYMIMTGREQAALHIVGMLTRNLASGSSTRTQRLAPSNILWPGASLKHLVKDPIELSTISHASGNSNEAWDSVLDDPRYATNMSETKNSTMTVVWTTLGSLIIQAADVKGDASSGIMNTLLLMLGQIHNLDLVPENVYSYRLSPLNTTVQRPPILHLVSSRILTALSDASWRDQQMQMIEKAISHGVSHKEVSRDPPGGRFRLKVRPLEPEVWLEFVLWCCAEGGFATAGSRIIEQLRQQIADPWFAVTWSSNSGTSQTSPKVDWDRVRLRHGGSVGLIEGYSREKPFVEVPSRTISTEVVLSLVDASIESVSRGISGRGARLEVVQKNITDMVAFLEPHDLPLGYFDYLAVRLIQTDAFDMVNDPNSMRRWYDRLTLMKALEPARPRPFPKVSYELDSLAAHSELFAGLLHQALNGYVQLGDVHRGLEVFNELQELVDASKLHAITAFIHGGSDAARSTEPDDSSWKYRNARKDFVGSHGHLPVNQLASLLDLATDTNLVGFGQWLLYNDDPDGPLITQSMYSYPSMSRVLLRFASLSGDRELHRSIMLAPKSNTLKPTVKVLRAQANAYISNFDIAKAKEPLRQLQRAQGGGYGLINLVHLAATMIKVEFGDSTKVGKNIFRHDVLHDCQRLLEDMLDGRFETRGGDFALSTRVAFQQQVASLIRVFNVYPNSVLARTASKYANKYRFGNAPSLGPSIFNVFLEAVVQARGASEGINLWGKFCVEAGTNEIVEGQSLINDNLAVDAFNYQEGLEWNDQGSQGEDLAVSISDMVQTTIRDSDASHNESFVGGPSIFATEPEEEHTSPPISDISFAGPALDRLDTLTRGLFPGSLSASNDEIPTSRDSYPVTVPNQRSLRIIVRGAVNELRSLTPKTDQSRRNMKRSGKLREVQTQRDILLWAKRQMKAMGFSNEMIEFEIQQPLSAADVKELEQRNFISKDVASRTYNPIPRSKTLGKFFKGQLLTRPTD